MVVPPGYGVGDFIAVGQLAWKVYKACKGAPGEFQELSRELSSLHIILAELEDDAKTPTSLLNRRGASRKAELDARIEGVLDDLIRDIKSGKKEPSVVSAHEDTDEAAWTELERELIGDGITKQDIEKHKDDIKDSLKRL
ncbi:uncharacterized protein LY89DRAFT_602667, partial [Mollisia scopiformis]